MPAQSESQRRLFGMVLAAKRGQIKTSSVKVKKIASHMSESKAMDFAAKKKRQHSSLRKKLAASLMSGKSEY